MAGQEISINKIYDARGLEIINANYFNQEKTYLVVSLDYSKGQRKAFQQFLLSVEELLTLAAINVGDEGEIAYAAAGGTSLAYSPSLVFNGTTLSTVNISLSGSLGSTGTRVVKGWFTDLEVTNDIVGDITGNAATATNATTAGTVTSIGNLTGDVTSINRATTISTGAVDLAMLSATGTPSVSTYLRGDNTWATGISTTGTPVANDFAKFTNAYTVEGRSYAETRSDLGLVIGTNIQAWDVNLDQVAALAVTDGNIIVGNGSAWVAESGSTARASLGLTIGTHVQAWDINLDQIAALTPTDSNFIVGNGSAWVTESGATARTSLGLGSLATLSTINNSNWSGTDLSVTNGGTGVSTLTGYVKGTGTSAFTASATIPNTDITGLGTMSVQNANTVAITGGSITGLTTLSVDNITIDGNTISSTNVDGNINLTPNGNGVVAVGSLSLTGDGDILNNSGSISLFAASNIVLDVGGAGTVQTDSTHTSNIAGANDVITKGYFEANVITGGWPLLAPNGNPANPQYSWANDTDTGLYFPDVAAMNVTIAGTNKVTFYANGIQFSESGGGTIRLPKNPNVGATFGELRYDNGDSGALEVYNDSVWHAFYPVEGVKEAIYLEEGFSTHEEGLSLIEIQVPLKIWNRSYFWGISGAGDSEDIFVPAEIGISNIVGVSVMIVGNDGNLYGSKATNGFIWDILVVSSDTYVRVTIVNTTLTGANFNTVAERVRVCITYKA